MSKSTKRIACIAAGAFLATVVSMLWAQPGSFEAAPALPGTQLVPAALMKGSNYEVADPVPIDRFLGRFELRSAEGTFRTSGVEMLAIRVRELRAIEALKKVESSSAFTDALAKSAAAPVKFVGSLVTDPGTTVESVATGAGTVLGRIGYSVKSGAQNVGDAMTKPATKTDQKNADQKNAAGGEPPAFTGDPLGYNQARREWAKKLEVDPYTSNPVLRPLLDSAASATFAGNFAVNATIGAVAAPLQYASEFDSTVRDSIWNQPPIDLAKANEQKLQRIGVPADVVRALLRNKWYTPTLQTALVAAVDKLAGVAGRDAVIKTASTIQGEVPARFLLRSLLLLSDYQQREGGVARIRMHGIVPVGQLKDGMLVAAAAIDYLSWNEESAAFAQAKELGAAKRTLLVAGEASARANEEFSKHGWNVRAGLRPVRT